AGGARCHLLLLSDGKTAIDFPPTPSHLRDGDLQVCLLVSTLRNQGAASKCSSPSVDGRRA
ncbi:hypothetical protein BCR35DRAFT_299554, partial [Leucosporidium creatinivorum]